MSTQLEPADAAIPSERVMWCWRQCCWLYVCCRGFSMLQRKVNSIWEYREPPPAIGNLTKQKIKYLQHLSRCADSLLSAQECMVTVRARTNSASLAIKQSWCNLVREKLLPKYNSNTNNSGAKLRQARAALNDEATGDLERGSRHA